MRERAKRRADPCQCPVPLRDSRLSLRGLRYWPTHFVNSRRSSLRREHVLPRALLHRRTRPTTTVTTRPLSRPADGVPGCGRVVAEIGLHLAEVGSTAPHVCEGVGGRSAQPSNRLIGEDRPRMREPVDALANGGQRLFQSVNAGLHDRVFSLLDVPEGIAEGADFLRQVSEIGQHILRRQIDF
jgi:hypothetical protein